MMMRMVETGRDSSEAFKLVSSWGGAIPPDYYLRLTGGVDEINN